MINIQIVRNIENMKERKIREIETEILKEPREERFPKFKELDLKKEINDALSELKDNYIVSELKFIVERMKESKSCYLVLNTKDFEKLDKFIQSIAQCQMILEKIGSKL